MVDYKLVMEEYIKDLYGKHKDLERTSKSGYDFGKVDMLRELINDLSKMFGIEL